MRFEELDCIEQFMAKEMVARAVARGVQPTEVLNNIAKLRVKLGMSIDVCPCGKDTDRGCISAKCYREIQEQGRCHCGAFKRISF